MQDTVTTTPKKATNVTLAPQMLARARELKINISEAAEQGLAAAISKRMSELWAQENRVALESSNAFVAANGLPLAKYSNILGLT